MSDSNFEDWEMPKPSLGRSALEFIGEVVKVVVISLAIIIPTRYFLIQPFYVKGASMEPNFFNHEYLIIDEISYRFREPVRGEIVVFRYPRDHKQFFIKRIIGLPNEKVQIKNGEVIIYNEMQPDGALLDESPYLHEPVKTAGEVIVELGDEEYFVMGDNRNASLDSRNFGAVSKELITGRTLLRGFPFDKITLFDIPEVGFELNYEEPSN